MESATTIAAFASLVLSLVNFAWHIYKMNLEKDEAREKAKRVKEDFENQYFQLEKKTPAEEYADTVDYERNKTLNRSIVIDIFNKGFYEGKEFEKRKKIRQG